jgi:hypothetical protein
LEKAADAVATALIAEVVDQMTREIAQEVLDERPPPPPPKPTTVLPPPLAICNVRDPLWVAGCGAACLFCNVCNLRSLWNVTVRTHHADRVPYSPPRPLGLVRFGACLCLLVCLFACVLRVRVACACFIPSWGPLVPNSR